jgi:hypothetical protein
VDMCKGKRKYDHEALMTSSLSDCTWLEKEWKIRLSTTWHPSLHFFFHLIHPSHIFLATPLLSFYSFLSLSHTHLFIFLYFSIFFFLSFPYSYISLYFSLSWHLFKALNSSLSCMHTIWNFK